MKKVTRVLGVFAGVVVLLVGGARVFGFDPGVTRPGMWLTGDVVTEPVTDWSFGMQFPGWTGSKVPGWTAIQTKQWFLPLLAHSVTTTRFHLDDRMYIGSGYAAGLELPDNRHWNRNVLADPRVRIRIGDKLYDKTLVYVTDPKEREAVLMTLESRFWAPGFFLHLWRVEPLE